MAANKEKFLESAQKNLKKKQIAKAIKDFLKVLEIDPADVRSRQKVAELFVRTNKPAEAFEHYETVAKYFSSNGFYLKAIAIYKQMQRLDPSQVSIFNRLAELNEKQGLIGNALAEYRNLVNYYERNGMVADAIRTLEKMRDADNSNLNIRVKLAEIYASNDRHDEGLAEFESVLAALTERKEYDKILKLYKILLPQYPNNQKLEMGLARTFYAKGELEQGIAILNKLLKDHPESPDLLRLLARGHVDLQDWPQARQTYETLLRLDPSDLDTREQLLDVLFASEAYEPALVELEEWKDAFQKSGRTQRLKADYERLQEQLPDNPQVRQTLDSIYELTGEGDKLLDIISERESEPEEIDIEETLSDDLLESVEDDMEIPVLDLEDHTGDQEATFDLEEESEDRELVFDLEDEGGTDEGLVLEPVPEEEEGLLLEPVDEQEELFELDVSGGGDLQFDFGPEESGAAAPSDLAGRDLQAELEEADFYIQQGLYAEAEKLCRELLAAAPDSVECQQKLEELSAHLQQPEELEESDFSLDLEDLDVFDQALGPTESDSTAPEEVQGQEERKVFRTDVDEQIAADDKESHYNLGIAYREMGLLDDAISEFDKASEDPARHADCQLLKALCFADKDDFASAEQIFQQALGEESLDSQQRLNLGFELALLYERCDRCEEALASYQAVYAQDEDYRDVREKVNELQSRLGVSSDDQLNEESGNKERISFL